MVTCANCGAEHPEGFEFCPSCGSSLKPAERTGEERKLVTILFADVTGSTELGEQLDPERLRSLLATYFSAMSAAIASWGGTVEKFIGDAIMAVFGVPFVKEDDAGRALRAALEMLARLDALNRDFQARHGVTLRIRIGVNTGEVIAPMGAGAQQLIVTGDAVNVAARLEQVAEPGTVLVGERTFLAARDAFRFGEPVPLELKGKAGSITSYPLVEVLPEARRGVPGLWSPMIGRDRELEALTSLFEEAIETNRPRLVTVFGPAGIGKSRLVQEFVRLTSSLRSDATVLRGRCVAAGHGITYWALGEILSAACGIVLDDSADVAEEKLRSGLSEILSALDLRDEELVQTVFALATTAGISLRDNPLERMEPREVADEIGRAWPRFASAYASRAPLVIAVEDLHWAGDQLLDMLERILARSSGPLVLVATARPEFAQSHPGFATGGEDASSISLRPLTPEQGVRLVEGLLTIADIPGELREDLLAKAEGNPFFLEEIIRRLIDEGALVREGDTWRATAAARQTTVPDTIHGLLAARVDGLPPLEKQVLQEAAVVGRVFWEEPVAQTLGNGTVSAALLELERKGLVFTRPTSSIAGQIEFMFKHALVRDVAYASLPKVRRARAHAEHGDWIERLAGDRVDELAELVAYHYGTAASGEDADLAWADDPPQGEAVRVKAVESLLLAGEVARRRYAIDKAVALHEQVLSLARSDRERARGLEELGDDHAAAFHGDEAVESYLESLTLLRPHPAAISARVRLCRKAARMAAEKFGAFRSPPDPSLVDDLIQEGLSAAADDEPRAWLLTLSGESSLYWRAMKGDDPVPMQRRIDSVREALALSERLDQPDLQIFAIRTLSELYEVAGSYELSIETARRQLALLDRVESASERALSLFSVGMGLADLVGEYDEAIELSRQSYELAKGLSSHERMHGLYGQINPLYHLGRWDEVLSLLEEHVEYFRLEADVSCFGVRGGIMFGALTLARRGRVERSMELEALVPRLDRALRGEGLRALLASATGDHEGARTLAADVLARAEATWRAPESALAMVEALAALGLWEELTEHVAHVRNFAGALVTLDPTCDRAEGLVRAAQGDLDAAADLLGRSLEAFDRLGERYEAARTKEALAGVTRTERARDLFTEALGQYEDLGAGPDADRVRALLGKA